MTQLWLSKIALKQTDFFKMASVLQQGADAYHRLVWTFFSEGHEGGERDFLFRCESTNRIGELIFWTLSARKPRVDPSLWQVETKLFDPKLQNGQRLEFMIRVNARKAYVPTDPEELKTLRTKQRVLSDGRSIEAFCFRKFDVMTIRRRELKREQPELRRKFLDISEEALTDWLEQIAHKTNNKLSKERGYNLLENIPLRVSKVETFRIEKEGYDQYTIFRSADVKGALVVTDYKAFAETLRQGIGGARAYGCGMFMIRPLPADFMDFAVE